MRKKLESVKTITFSKHFHEPKVRLRGIDEDKIKNHLEKGV